MSEIARPDNLLDDLQTDRFIKRFMPFNVKVVFTGKNLPLDACEWCEEQFGPDCITDIRVDGKYYCIATTPYRWTMYVGGYFFDSEVNASAFKIRWG